METAIWIAVISAFGVIGSAFIQWRSNKATLTETEKREVAEREDRNRQVAADREHQRLLAAEADARALELKKWEAEKALAETWRPKRAQAHEKALRAIESYRQAANSEKVAFYIANGRKGPLTEVKQPFGKVVADLDAASIDVDTYGSEAASSRFQDVRTAFISIHSAIMTKRLLSPKEPVDNHELKRIESAMNQLEVSIQEYRKAAKADIGTEA